MAQGCALSRFHDVLLRVFFSVRVYRFFVEAGLEGAGAAYAHV